MAFTECRLVASGGNYDGHQATVEQYQCAEGIVKLNVYDSLMGEILRRDRLATVTERTVKSLLETVDEYKAIVKDLKSRSGGVLCFEQPLSDPSGTSGPR